MANDIRRARYGRALKSNQLFKADKAILKSSRQRGLQRQCLFFARMQKCELPGVQQLARGGKAGLLRQPLVLPVAVGGVAHHRMAQVLKMDADLMSATGMQLCFQPGGRVQTLADFVAGPGFAAGAVGDSHAFAVTGVARDGGADFAGFLRDLLTDVDTVNLFQRAAGELFGQRDVRGVVLGHDQTTAGFLVETMHDARSRHATDAAEFPGAMVEQGVDQRVFLVSGGGILPPNPRFVQDQQVLVLEQNVQRNVLGQRLGGTGVGPMDLDLFAGARHGWAWTIWPSTRMCPSLDQTLNGSARNRRKLRPQPDVQPIHRQRDFNRDLLSARIHLAITFPDCVWSREDMVHARLAVGWAGLGTKPVLFLHDRMKIRPTPMQMALSATLKAGKPMFLAAALLQVEAEKVRDVLGHDAVGEIAQDAAEDQTKRHLTELGVGIEIMPAHEQHKQGENRDDGQHPVVIVEHTPGRAGIPPMHKFEKAVNNHLFVALVQPAQDTTGRALVN